MVAKEYFEQPGLQESNDHFQDFDHEAEETLSLCDLVESSNWNDNDSSSSKEEHQSASDDQDFFEFFSEDFTASSTGSYPSDGIIFCGKLIPYKEQAAIDPEQTQKQNNVKKNRIFPWKSNSFNRSRSTLTKVQQQDQSSYMYRALSQRKGHQKYSYEYDIPVKEVSAQATSVKPRWYLLAFGHGRFPTEMKLRDIKNGQSRRIPASMFRSDGGGERVKSSEKRSAWKGFWALLKVLGYQNQQANAVVKASFECIRHV